MDMGSPQGKRRRRPRELIVTLTIGVAGVGWIAYRLWIGGFNPGSVFNALGVGAFMYWSLRQVAQSGE